MSEPAALGDHMSDLVGQQIGNYRIEALLGTGGMGQVFRARHLLLERPVALKIMHANLALDPAFQARFRQEARSAAALHHPNIVEVFDFDEQAGHAYLVMELVTGGSLRNLLQEGNAHDADWSLARGLDLVRQAADALAYAHALGMVHRDIKPDNLLLQPNPAAPPSLKVGDFGLARLGEGSGLTAANTAMGTPAYMSPEQCQGQELDGRSDIYALGIVLYEIATGTLPFAIRTVGEAVFKHVYTMPTPPSSARPELPQPLDELILRCLAKAPADRYASAADLAAALREMTGALDTGSSISMLFSVPPVSTQPAPGTPMAAPSGAVPHVSTLPGSASLPRVQVLDESGTLLQVLAIRPGGMSFGRMHSNDVQLDAPSISRHHLQLSWDGARISVTDLGSRSGTQLGEALLTPHAPTEWPWGTLLRVGPYWLRLDPPPGPAVQPAGEQPGPTPQAGAPPVMASFVSSGRLSLTLDQDVLSLTPGQPASIEATVLNASAAPELVSLSVTGFPEEWVTLPPSTQIEPNGQATMRLAVNVPQESSARAGEYPVEVRARSRTSAEGGAVLARWSVLPFASVELSVGPARLTSRRRGRFRITLRNDGNAPVSYRLAATDEEGLLAYSFADEHLTVPPGESASVGLQVERGLRLLGGEQQNRVEVRAQALDGGPPQVNTALFVHQPLVPIWMFGLSGAMLAVGMFGALAAGLINSGAPRPTPTADAQPVALAATGAVQTETVLAAAGVQATATAQALAAAQAGTTATALQTSAVAQVDQSNATEVAAQQQALAEQTAQAAGQAEQTAQAQQQGQQAQQAQQTAQAQQGQQAEQTAQAQQGQQAQQQTATAQAQQASASATALMDQRATAAAATQTAVITQGFAQQTAIAVTQTAEALVVQETQAVIQQAQTAAALAEQASATAQAAAIAQQTAVVQTATAQQQATNTAITLIRQAEATASTQTAVALTQTAGTANQIVSTSFAPGSPATLPSGAQISVTFAYTTNDTGGVRIWFMPYRETNLAPGGFYSSSGVFSSGSGNGAASFGVSGGPVMVDRVRVLMRSESTGATLLEQYIPVSYQFGP